jgi:nitrate/nitrite transporter NarK
VQQVESTAILLRPIGGIVADKIARLISTPFAVTFICKSVALPMPAISNGTRAGQVTFQFEDPW